MPPSVPRWQVVSTLAVIVLSVTATVLGLLLPGHYRDPPALVSLYRAQDAAVLLVGVPVLVVGCRVTPEGFCVMPRPPLRVQ